MTPVSPSAPFVAAALCASWCRTCEAWRPVFDAAVAVLRAEGVAIESRWIDIEDEAAWLGDLDIETFPTLLVLAPGGGVRFAGPLAPQPATLERVLRQSLAGEAGRFAGWDTLARTLAHEAAARSDAGGHAT